MGGQVPLPPVDGLGLLFIVVAVVALVATLIRES